MRSPLVFCLSFALFALAGGTSPRGCGEDPLDAIFTASSMRITPANPTIAQGSTQQFTAVVTFRDGHTEDLMSSVAWSSSNTAVATINSTGLASGVGPGTTTIRGSFQDVSSTTTLTVTATQPAASISGGSKNAMVTINESSRSFAYVADEAADRLLLYVVLDGALEPAGELRFAPGSRPAGLAVHPSGEFLYVINQDAKNVAGFALNAWSGTLTPIGPPVALLGSPEAIEFDTAGEVATVTILESWEAQRLRIQSETGEMLPMEVVKRR
ncbi:MAG: Ig-like domain-containing protein [Terriglobales bacterium]